MTESNATHAQVNRSLLAEFAGVLARTDWTVALLQEAPPRWLRRLCEGAGAGGASALTSRNFGAAARDLAARWNPDLIASAEGGSNQMLFRGPWRLREVRRMTLARRPERRRMLWCRLEAPATGRASAPAILAVANLHASNLPLGAAAAEVRLGAERAVSWAAGAPLIFGGDLNVRPAENPDLFDDLRDRFGLVGPTAPHAIDHLLARDLDVLAPPSPWPAEWREVPDSWGEAGLAVRLSDHAPVAAAFGMK